MIILKIKPFRSNHEPKKLFIIAIFVKIVNFPSPNIFANPIGNINYSLFGTGCYLRLPSRPRYMSLQIVDQNLLNAD